MDPLTQGLIGALAAQLALRRRAARVDTAQTAPDDLAAALWRLIWQGDARYRPFPQHAKGATER